MLGFFTTHEKIAGRDFVNEYLRSRYLPAFFLRGCIRAGQ